MKEEKLITTIIGIVISIPCFLWLLSLAFSLINTSLGLLLVILTALCVVGLEVFAVYKLVNKNRIKKQKPKELEEKEKIYEFGSWREKEKYGNKN